MNPGTAEKSCIFTKEIEYALRNRVRDTQLQSLGSIPCRSYSRYT